MGRPAFRACQRISRWGNSPFAKLRGRAGARWPGLLPEFQRGTISGSHVTPNHHFGARLWSTSGTRLLAACPPTATTSCVLYHTRSTARLSRRILIASPTAGSPEQHRFIFSQLVRTRVDEEETRSNRAQRAATRTNVVSLNRIAHRTRPAVATDVLWAIRYR